MYSIMELVQGEIIVKNSRFIGILMPVENEGLVPEILKDTREFYLGANHYCYAYIIGDNQKHQKASDDGEPQKTAGIPILEVLKKNNFTDVLAISIRYFGGTLLGASGLIRAYSKSISCLISSTQLTEKINYTRCLVTLDYATHNHLQKFLNESAKVEKTEYLERVTVTFSVATQRLNEFMSRVKELGFGQFEVEIMENYSFYDFI